MDHHEQRERTVQKEGIGTCACSTELYIPRGVSESWDHRDYHRIVGELFKAQKEWKGRMMIRKIQL